MHNDAHHDNHPAHSSCSSGCASSKPTEPEHPMSLEGGIVDGSTAFMFQCIVEELLGAGIQPSQIRDMSANPEYQALYAARCALGDRADEIVSSVAARVGTQRARMWESHSQDIPATLTVSASNTHRPSTNREGE